MKLGGAVLVGGASRRMGVDKATLLVEGVPMGRRVAEALRIAGCTPVLAVGAVPDQLDALNLAGLADDYPGEGPLGGLVTALRTFGDTVDLVVVAACDLPWLDAHTVSAVVSAVSLAAGDCDGAQACAHGRPALCLALRPATLISLSQTFDEGGRALLSAFADLKIADIAVSSTALRNINSPADLTAH